MCFITYLLIFKASIRGKLLRSGEFTDHEINKGIELLVVLHANNVNFEEVSKLSRLQDQEIIDPSILYDVLQNWKNRIGIKSSN